MKAYKKTKQFLLKKIKIKPHLAIIGGSGIKLFPNHSPILVINYTDLLHSSLISYDSSLKVKGHEGKLKLFKIKDKHILIFAGRKHLYEGMDITQVITNVRIAYDLGIKNLIVTNAAGGINSKFKPGDLMLITGFIDLMQSTERGVIGALIQKPAKVKSKLNNFIKKISKNKIKYGIYAGMLGPSYETFAEIKLLKLLGADAVGMSTIPELICAKSLRLNATGISIISNIWSKTHKPSHEEVLRNVQKANEKFNDLILKILDNI